MAYSGAVALVTGGGSGMGRIAARNCAKTGAAVAILDLNEEGMAETAGEFPNIHRFTVDITDADGNTRSCQRRHNCFISLTASARPLKTERAMILWPMFSSVMASMSVISETFW